MTMGVFDFKAIKRKLDCQEQKAEYDAKNPKPNPVIWTPEWGYGVPVPMQAPDWPVILKAWGVK